MAEKFFVKAMANGMTVLGQVMEQVTSAAMTLVAPAGSSHDPAELAGSAAVASEWILRGAGGRNTRQLHEALDSLGCQHHENVQSEYIQFATAQLGSNLPAVLEIYSDIIRRPGLEESTFEPCRALTMQDLISLEDEPGQKCNLMLREKFYPDPLGRSPYGTAQTLEGLTAAKVRANTLEHLNPHGSMVAVAGRFDWAKLCDQVEKCFGDWVCPPLDKPSIVKPVNGVTQIQKDSAQSHIAIAHKAANVGDANYYAARLAETVLSGGMSGRLFTEVREKRGLVYHVSSRYHSLKGHAGMFTYAGTTPEKAQQTLDVTVGELRRLGEGVTQEELFRARTQLRSALVMQGESTSSRANSLASDWYHLGHLRSLEEISEAINAVTADDIVQYMHQYPARNFTILTIGPNPLDVKAISE